MTERNTINPRCLRTPDMPEWARWVWIHPEQGRAYFDRKPYDDARFFPALGYGVRPRPKLRCKTEAPSIYINEVGTLYRIVKRGAEPL